MFSFFDQKVVLNCQSAVERMRLTASELQRVGITDYTRFEAVPDIGPHESFNRSVNYILRSFLISGANRLLLIEDDILFVGTGHLPAALEELPEDWDVVYLGANLQEQGFKAPVRHSKHLCRVFDAWTTHCIGFSRKAVKRLIIGQPGYSERMFDNWLSSQLSELNAFCVTPLVAIQRPGNSLIWKANTDYTNIFTKSDQILINAK
jgi:hypothetical protein